MRLDAMIDSRRPGLIEGREIALRRFSASLLLLLALAACGFHPLLSERAEAVDAPALAAIVVQPIPNRIGQELAWSLREALNPDGLSVEPRYSLSVSLTQTRVDLGIQRDATSTRGRVDVVVQLALSELKSGKVVYTSRAQSTSAFNVLQDAYAAQVSEEDARTRTTRDLAQEIRTRLALFMRRQARKSG
jgi:LPS-assembly lipoprotein